MAEDFGVEDRGSFTTPSERLVRHAVQNHRLQVLALVTMELPVGSAPMTFNDKKAEASGRWRCWIPIGA